MNTREIQGKEEAFWVQLGSDIVSPGHPLMRDCAEQLDKFIKDDRVSYGRVCVLYGLRRTGKTHMMMQYIAGMPDQEKGQSAYILCDKPAEMWQLKSTMDSLREKGIKKFFIDEITRITGFLDYSSILADGYASCGCKVVLAGTDSLMLRLAESGQLFDRTVTIKTSHVPFAEYSRLLGGRSLDDYIADGGLLEDGIFRDERGRRDFLKTSIAENIFHSLHTRNAMEKPWGTLAVNHSQEELVTAVNRIVNYFSYTIVADAVNEAFVSSPFHATINNMASEKNYGELIDVRSVDESVKDALGILDPSKGEMPEFTGEDLLQLKKYLEDIGLFLSIQMEQSATAPSDARVLEIILQPGLATAQSEVLIHALADNRNWFDRECPYRDRKDFMERTKGYVRGRVMENILLAETYSALARDNGKYGRFYVSQLSVSRAQAAPEYAGDNAEADLIVVDWEKNASYLFEVKHTPNAFHGQSRHIGNSDFLAYVGRNFAPVAGSAVIYSGPDGELEIGKEGGRVRYLNAENFLMGIHAMSRQPLQEIEFGKVFRGQEHNAPARAYSVPVEEGQGRNPYGKPKVPKRRNIPKKEISRRDGGGAFFQDGADVQYQGAVLGNAFVGPDGVVACWSDVYACGRREGEETPPADSFLPSGLAFYRNRDQGISAAWAGKNGHTTGSLKTLQDISQCHEQEAALLAATEYAERQIFGQEHIA